MPFEKVDPKVDFPVLERDILAFWERTGAFNKLREINRGKPKWSFLDGPITANNPMGVHHAWGRTYKDIYQRYNASLGRELRYQNGFDCQGLWVEVEVEKERGFTCKKDIEAYGIGKFVEECKARACKFAAQQSQQSQRLGYWMDWDNSYYTMSDDNNYGIWAFLKKCHEKGLVYRGADVMPWCPRCGTGLSQMELNEGYREVGHTSVFVAFSLLDKPNESLLVWTTTPWTLSSNVAAAVKPDMKYVKVRQGDRSFYMGKGNFEAARKQPIENAEKLKAPSLMSIQALFKNNGAFEVVEELPGKALIGRKYHGPFDQLAGAAEAVPGHAVIAWDSVTETEGTGIVHIAPGCGAEDYALGKELGLPQIAPLLEDGKFRSEFGFLAGKRFDQVADEVVGDLKKRGLLFAKEQYWHRYPHCWRCKDELVYRLVDEWFINMNWRDEIMESARQSQWIPAWGLERELDWLRNMGDWMISKKRYWGLALPIWECHKCGHFDVIGGREELKARAASGWEEFEGNSPHRPWVDSVKISCSQCGDEGMTRIKDVGNPWLDASIVPFSTMGYFSDREYWKQWFPAEFVVEALPGQFRNWFYALLTVSTMMEGVSPFKVLKGHGLVLDDEGKPMHKSAGNAIEFNQAADSIGVDVMRWLYASTPPERNVLFGPHHCDEVRRDVVLPLWNVYSFFCNMPRVDDFQPGVHSAMPKELSKLDRWIISDLHSFIQSAHEGFREFDVARVCSEAKRFIDALSTWYVRRSRPRFYGKGWPADKRAAYSTLYEVLTTFTRVLAPIIPFLSEAIYQNLVANQSGDHPESVHHISFPQANLDLIDKDLSSLVAASRFITSLGRSARKDSNLNTRQPLSRMIIASQDDQVLRASKAFSEDLMAELNVKSIEQEKVEPGTKVRAELAESVIKPIKKTIDQDFRAKGKAVFVKIECALALDPHKFWSTMRADNEWVTEVDGERVHIFMKHLQHTMRYGPGWAGAWDGRSEGNTVVLLSTIITQELKNEGLAREIIRRVQDLRKDNGLDLNEDRIRLSLATDSQVLKEAIVAFYNYIAGPTLAKEIVGSLEGNQKTVEVEIDGQKLVIGLEKV